MQEPVICKRCGAPLKSDVCEYCGTIYAPPIAERIGLAQSLLNGGYITADEARSYACTGRMSTERDIARKESRDRVVLYADGVPVEVK
jgi:hypothetical protein